MTPVEQGAAAFEAGNVDEAMEVWQAAAAEGPASAALAQDLGRAHWEKHEIPAAIAWWRQAKRLSPRDADVAHDLAFARAALGAVPAPVPAPAAWTDAATPGEVGALGVVVCALGSAAAVLARRRRADVAVAVPVGLVALTGVGLVVTATLGHRAWVTRPVGVIASPAALRDLPALEATGKDVLPAGAEVWVDGARDGFVRVHAGDGREGWVVADRLWQVGPGCDPLTRAARPPG